MTASCGCGYEWDGNLDDGEHECPADRHLQGCACADRYQVCEAASDSEEGVDDVAARPWRPSWSSKETRKNLYVCARDLRWTFITGDGIKDPEYQDRVRALLQAVIQWRESARENRLIAGLPESGRPRFTEIPPDPDPKKPPTRKKYSRRVRWWASRYAWNVADGLSSEDSALRLVQTAIVGTKEGRELRQLAVARAQVGVRRRERKPDGAANTNPVLGVQS